MNQDIIWQGIKSSTVSIISFMIALRLAKSKVFRFEVNQLQSSKVSVSQPKIADNLDSSINGCRSKANKTFVFEFVYKNRLMTREVVT